MHEHNHRLDVRALEIGLPYLLKHNKDHVKDIEKWIKRAKVAGYDGIAQDLQKVIELSHKISEHFEAALKKLK